MVKADPKRNYYADLEVRPDADTEDIKKQFRKLALKFHPDRNPGRESECLPRFQAIQAAHEILSDSSARLKYDADRRKQGYFANARPNVPPRRNHYEAYSDFPPPPRRTQAPTSRYSRPAANPPPPPPPPQSAQNGANRFANFANTRPSSARTGMPDGPDARANMFNAWQNMNKPKYNPTVGDSAERPQTAWESWQSAKAKMGRSNTTTERSRKKAGFDPMAAGADEPQVRSSAYTSRYARPPPPQHNQTEMPPSQDTPKRPDPMAHVRDRVSDDVPYFEGNRRSPSSYGFTPGEKTALFDEGIRRSASQRTTPTRPDSTDMHSGSKASSARTGRHRSASPSYRQYPANAQARPGPSTAQPRRKATPKRGGNAKHPFFMYGSSEPDDSSDPDVSSSSPSQATPGRPGRQSAPESETPKANGHHVPPPPKDKPFSASKFHSPTARHSTPNGGLGQKSHSSIFNFTPMDANNPTATPKSPEVFKARSTESINTKFSPNDWHGKFQGAPNYFTTPLQKASSAGQNNRSRTSPTRGRPQRPRAQTQMSGSDYENPAPAVQNPFSNIPTKFPPPPPGPPPKAAEAAPPSANGAANGGGVKFTPEEWARTFKDSTWVLSDDKKPSWSTSPTRSASATTSRRPSKTPKSRVQNQTNGQKVPTTEPKPATVDEVVDEAEKLAVPSFGASVQAGSAADWAKAKAQQKNVQSPRSDTDSNAMDIDTEPNFPSSAGGPPIGGVPAMPPPPTTAPPSSPGTKRRNFSATSNVSNGPDLTDLRNVAPFSPDATATGLSDLKGTLGQTLPFESTASSGLGGLKSFEPRNLEIPPPPKIPAEPGRLTSASWKDFANSVGMYLTNWKVWEGKMQAHFSTRQQNTLSGKSAVNALLSVGAGESVNGVFGTGVVIAAEGTMGWLSYLQGGKEDEKVREHWNVAWERHTKFLERVEELRQKAVRGFAPAQ